MRFLPVHRSPNNLGCSDACFLAARHWFTYYVSSRLYLYRCAVRTPLYLPTLFTGFTTTHITAARCRRDSRLLLHAFFFWFALHHGSGQPRHLTRHSLALPNAWTSVSGWLHHRATHLTTNSAADSCTLVCRSPACWLYCRSPRLRALRLQRFARHVSTGYGCRFMALAIGCCDTTRAAAYPANARK